MDREALDLSGNEFVVWDLLTEGPKGLHELHEESGLAKSTLSAVIGRLKGKGVVRTDLVRRPGRGRPPVLVSLAESGGVCAAVDVGHFGVRVGLFESSGVPRHIQDALRVDVLDTPSMALALIEEGVRSALEFLTVEKRELRGVGVSVPIPLHPVTRKASGLTSMDQWGRDPAGTIRRALERVVGLDCPIQIGNDANLCVLGEQRWGLAQDYRNCLFVKMSTGIGIGLMLNGTIYEGENGLAGECGHLPVVAAEYPKVEACDKCHKVCLNTAASVIGIKRRLGHKYETGFSIHEVLQNAQGGDRECRLEIEQAGRAVGRVLRDMVRILDPGIVIVGGVLSSAGDVLLKAFEAELLGGEKRAKEPQVVQPDNWRLAGLRGAAALVMTTTAPVRVESGIVKPASS